MSESLWPKLAADARLRVGQSPTHDRLLSDATTAIRPMLRAPALHIS